MSRNTVRILGLLSVTIIVGIVAIRSIQPDRKITTAQENNEQGFEIVSLLPRDAIPAIDNPQFVSGADADAIYHPEELVLGVEIDGDARAYSVPFLSGHEIVNDEVGGVSIAVTW